MNISYLFFLLARPFIHHISGFLLVILIFNLAYTLIYFIKKDKLKNRKKLNRVIVIGAIILGCYLRISLAYFSSGNYDVNSYEVVVKLISQGKNVYAFTDRYNYSPLWFILLSVLNKINNLFPGLSLRFIVRLFLSLVDLASLLVLYKISRLKKIFFPLVVVGFFLNPISILITGHHGQFENLTILFILMGIYVFLKNKKSKLAGSLFILAGLTKHIVFNQVLAFFNFCFKQKKKVVIYFVISALIFLATFIPFWQQGREGIIDNVFLYKSLEGGYGLSYFLNLISSSFSQYYGYVFILLLFLFAFKFKAKNLIGNVLTNILFFLTFTSGMSDQYLVLPIAIGFLNKSIWLPVYILFASLYLFQSPAQLNLGRYSFVSANIVWLVVAICFVMEYFKTHEARS